MMDYNKTTKREGGEEAEVRKVFTYTPSLVKTVVIGHFLFANKEEIGDNAQIGADIDPETGEVSIFLKEQALV